MGESVVAKLLKKEILLETEKYSFNFQCLSGYTMIVCESANGLFYDNMKTLSTFYNLLQDYCIIIKSKEFIFINYKCDDIIQELKGKKGKIFVIDSMDVELPANYIQNDKDNQYIVLGQHLPKYGAKQKNIALLQEIQYKNKYYYNLFYLFAHDK